MDDTAKAAKVDGWLDAVSKASRRWRTARAAQAASDAVVSYLVKIRDRVDTDGALRERMDAAIARNAANAAELADAALAQSELESGFYAVLPHVDPPEVAEAWRMRCMEGKTWAQCSMALHYNRTHLERLSRRAKAEVYELIPESYRCGDGGQP